MLAALLRVPTCFLCSAGEALADIEIDYGIDDIPISDYTDLHKLTSTLGVELCHVDSDGAPDGERLPDPTAAPDVITAADPEAVAKMVAELNDKDREAYPHMRGSFDFLTGGEVVSKL